jgi:hypothetical protein
MPHALTACVLLTLAVVPGLEVGTGPEPSPQPISWELGFRFLDPQRIEVQLPGRSTPEVYWYMVYTVTNHGERSRSFFPTFQLVTSDLRVIDTDMGISALVFSAIQQRHRQTHKYLVHPTQAIGELRRGDDYALESVAIWRDVELNTGSFCIYVAGLSGETRFVANRAYDPDLPETVINPDGRERAVNPKHFALRKTLEIRYNLPGSPAARSVADPERVGTRWLMR